MNQHLFSIFISFSFFFFMKIRKKNKNSASDTHFLKENKKERKRKLYQADSLLNKNRRLKMELVNTHTVMIITMSKNQFKENLKRITTNNLN